MIPSNSKLQNTSVVPPKPLELLVLPLLYFEIFSHPLRSEELFHFAHEAFNPTDLEPVLEQLVLRKQLYEIDGYYTTQYQPDWITRRQQNEARAKKYLVRARWAVRLMRHFPFVRGIFISGSLSKGVIAKDGDVDYFIVTKVGRLWITRMLMVLFKKVFLLNSHKYFCINYFVDEEHLVIEEQNRFTATEVATILPYYNPVLYDSFRKANAWSRTYYPNAPARSTQDTLPLRASLIQRVSEYLLSGSLGERLDLWCMNRSIRFWQRKFANFDPERFKLALKSRPYASKHHPQDFQRKVRLAYEQGIRAYEATHNLKFQRTHQSWTKAI